MRFALSTEQTDFAASLHRQLEQADVPAAVRQWSAGEHDPGRKVLHGLSDSGVTALGIDERFGGLGAEPIDLVVAFVELGRAAVPGPVIETVAVVPALLSGSALGEQWLPRLADGSTLATVGVPRALDADVCDLVLAVQDQSLFLAEPSTHRESVDASRRLFEVVRGSAAVSESVSRALRFGSLACAAQLLGLGLSLADRTTAYAKERSQFGRPIGAFQAVKHALADAVVALEMARPLLYGAALSMGSADEARDVSAAKIACGDAAYRAARVALQVHGAIGYTAEYDLSLWLTKVRALQFAWGTAAEHRVVVGRELALQ